MPNPTLPDRLTADRTVLVVVDIQNKFREVIHGMEQLIATTERAIQFAQYLNIPVVVTEHYPRGLGATVPEIRHHFSQFSPLEKINFSCAGNALFNQTLSGHGRDQIVLCGIEAHICIYQTAFDLLRQGKQVAVLVDAVSSCSAANREIGLRRMSELGVQSMGFQMAAFEILGKAGTPAFKDLAPLLKD